MFLERADVTIGRRGHVQKQLKRRDARKFAFSNRVVNDWNSLSSQCVNRYFKNIFQLNWNRKLLNYISCVLFEMMVVIWRKPVLAHASCIHFTAGFGGIGETFCCQ